MLLLCAATVRCYCVLLLCAATVRCYCVLLLQFVSVGGFSLRAGREAAELAEPPPGGLPEGSLNRIQKTTKEAEVGYRGGALFFLFPFC